MSASPTDHCYRPQCSVYRSAVACRARLHPVSVALAISVRRLSRCAKGYGALQQVSKIVGSLVQPRNARTANHTNRQDCQVGRVHATL